MTHTNKWGFVSGASILLVVFVLSKLCGAQQASLTLLQPVEMQPAFSSAPAPAIELAPPAAAFEPRIQHRFWDRENSILFGATAALSAADFAATRANLRAGGQELNPVTRVFSGNTAGLAMNFAGETAGVVGLSYFFHKTGHHKLERAVSIVTIGSSAAAVTFDVAHH